jgi:hypothetical protein|tara:strand:+ start:2943 stop:3230 length:288 start_codon:yes stop_codon:yes gene_type:complete
MDELIITALIKEDVTEHEVDNVSKHQQKEYIKRYINAIPIIERAHVARVIVFNKKEDMMKECKEGTVINLEILPDFIMRQMYDLLKYKIDMIEQG